MALDFTDPAHSTTYSGRSADSTWLDMASRLVRPAGADVVDVGCGGGTYTRAFADLGAASVTGVDSSGPILHRARTDHADLPGVTFHLADATATGLPDASADLVFARALVHHLPELAPAFREAHRLLRPGGAYLVQDRTPGDVTQPAGPEHVRGHLFELVPGLLDVEVARRPEDQAVRTALLEAGFPAVAAHHLWETRRTHPDVEDYLSEIAARTGRSILHELSDTDLARLVVGLRRRLAPGPLVERDRWTLWLATRTAASAHTRDADVSAP